MEFGLRLVPPGEAARFLREGGVGLVPTETVVGLVAGKEGVDRLARIKGRDPGKPIALLCSSAAEAFARAREIPLLAQVLARRFWPGPLTLVLDAEGGGTVGVRVPDHPVVLAMLSSYAGPLYATSANPSGEPAPRRLEEVDPRISASVDFAVEGEPGDGEASAVVALSGDGVRLLRATRWLHDEELFRLANPSS